MQPNLRMEKLEREAGGRYPTYTYDTSLMTIGLLFAEIIIKITVSNTYNV